MTEYESSGQESTDVDKRTLRAATKSITLLENGPRVEGADGLYEAVPQSGGNEDDPDTYIVDARLVSCECPDHEYRDGHCKHLRRLEFIKGEREIPESIPAEDVNTNIGIGVKNGRTTEDLLEAREPTPASEASEKAIADGGEIVVAADEGEVLEDEDFVGDDGHPEGCACAEFLGDADLPCWPCYREGFREAAAADTESEDNE